MFIVKKSNFYKIIHDQNVQISSDVISELDGFVRRMLITAVEDIKENEKVKRISGEMLIAYIMKNIKKETNGNGKKCQRCAGIKDVFLKAGRDLQVMVVDEAKIALVSLERGEKYVK